VALAALVGACATGANRTGAAAPAGAGPGAAARADRREEPGATGSPGSAGETLSAEARTRAQLERALAEEDLAALEPLLRAAEEQAPASSDASGLWLLVARGWRLRADALAGHKSQAPLEAASGDSASDLLARLSREASACAAAAHHAWSALLPGAAAAIDAGQSPDAALAAAPAPAAEPLYLDALCSAAWARAQGFTFFVEQRSLLGAELARAAALSPRLDDAGPERELGRLFAALPGYAGGDLAQARSHFEAAIAAAPAALWNRVLYARSLAIKAQDRALFTRLLGEVLESPASGANDRAAQDEARSLLERADDLFGVAAVPH